MTLNPSDYLDATAWSRVRQLAESQESPFLVVSLDRIRAQYARLQKALPYAVPYYAVKANPAREVITLLRDLGACFDIASVYELERVLKLGVPPERLSCGNTIKKAQHVREFYRCGVRLFVSDSEADMRTLATEAPGARVFVRVLTEGSVTADWSLSRKFGCPSDMAIDLLLLARELNLQPYGLSFHVGSQQRDIGTWDAALSKVKFIFDWMREREGIRLQMLNLGGGFPADYLHPTHPIELYAREITRFLDEDFGAERPHIIVEPGRYLVADAGVLVSRVVLIARKSRTALNRWVYLDVGKFGGLIETMNESIKFPIHVERTGDTEPVVLAGPTCDSLDILYEDYKYPLPLSLAIDDVVYWFATGAYTSSYCSVDFNGFPPVAHGVYLTTARFRLGRLAPPSQTCTEMCCGNGLALRASTEFHGGVRQALNGMPSMEYRNHHPQAEIL